MNRRIWIIVVIAILAIGTISAVSYMKVKDPFLGAWESTDVDGSHQYLWVLYNVEGAYLSIYYDDGASACGGVLCEQGPPAVGVSAGHRVEEWGLTTDGFSAYCLKEAGPEWLPVFAEPSEEAAYTYDPTTDELVNIVEDSPCPPGGDVEVRWNRIGLGIIKHLLEGRQ